MKEIPSKSTAVLDLKEKKIILELFRRDRAPKTSMSKKLGLSNELLSYKLKRLESEGIIKNVIPIIDYGKLGFHIYRLQIRFNVIKKEQKKEFIEYISKMKSLSWLVELSGPWDLVIGFLIKETKEFEQIYNQIRERYAGVIKKKLFTIVTSIEHLSPNFIHKGERMSIMTGKEHNNIVLEENAKKILIALGKNGRLTLVDMAKKLQVSVSTIKYHMEFLESKKILVGYKPIIDATKFGLDYFKIMLEFTDAGKKTLAKEILRNNSNVTYLTESIGRYDLEFEAQFETVEDALMLLDKLRENIDISDIEIIFTNKEIIINEVL